MAAVDVARAVIARFPPEAWVTAVAVSGAESGWERAPAPADRCGGVAGPCSLACQGYCSFGPFQVNVCAHGALMRQLTGSPSPCAWKAWLEDYGHAAQAAYLVSNGGRDWSPWTTYTRGTYRRFIPQARSAIAAAGATPPQGPAAVAPKTIFYATLGVILVLAAIESVEEVTA